VNVYNEYATAIPRSRNWQRTHKIGRRRCTIHVEIKIYAKSNWRSNAVNVLKQTENRFRIRDVSLPLRTVNTRWH
jgi:hypothetical protein